MTERDHVYQFWLNLDTYLAEVSYFPFSRGLSFSFFSVYFLPIYLQTALKSLTLG